MNSRSLEVTFLESPPVPLRHLTDARLIRSPRCSPSRLPCGAGLPACLAPAGSGDLVLPRSGTGSAERRSAHGPFREGHRVRVTGRTCLNPRLLPGRRPPMAAGTRWPQVPDGRAVALFPSSSRDIGPRKGIGRDRGHAPVYPAAVCHARSESVGCGARLGVETGSRLSPALPSPVAKSRQDRPSLASGGPDTRLGALTSLFSAPGLLLTEPRLWARFPQRRNPSADRRCWPGPYVTPQPVPSLGPDRAPDLCAGALGALRFRTRPRVFTCSRGTGPVSPSTPENSNSIL